MDLGWRRVVLVAILVALAAMGVLEIMNSQLPAEPPFTGIVTSGEEPHSHLASRNPGPSGGLDAPEMVWPIENQAARVQRH